MPGIYELKNTNMILRTPPIQILPMQKQPNLEELRPQVASKLVHEGKTELKQFSSN